MRSAAMRAVGGAAAAAAAASLLAAGATGQSCGRPVQCRKFSEIYGDGRGICENMFGEAFAYETNESLGLVMWFEGRENPNVQVAANHPNLSHVSADQRNQCYLEYFHHDGPPVTNNNFNECRPWEGSACCANETVRSADALRRSYGESYEWDRCGPLSPQCERYFVKEACFYECDPVVGHWRRYFNTSLSGAQANLTYGQPGYDPECDPYAPAYNASKDCSIVGTNTWELYRAPIRASYCDDWYEACKDDYFCATGGGDFFSCAAHYEACDATVPPTAGAPSTGDDSVDTNLVIGVAVAGALAVLGVGAAVFLCVREKQGKALFKPQVDVNVNPTFEGNFDAAPE